MALARYTKTPTEKKRYQIDYTDWLDAGELAADVTFAVLNNTVVTPLVVGDKAVLPSGLGVQYYISGGAIGVTYEITATLTTSSSPPQIEQDKILMTIRGP